MNAYWSDLIKLLKSEYGAATGWRHQDFSRFCEAESILHLAETLIPDMAARPAEHLWTLISGYCISDINDSAESRRMSLSLRSRLQYANSAGAWLRMLRWYCAQSEAMRLYRFHEDANGDLLFQRKPYTPFLQERVDAYLAACDASERGAVSKPRPWATAGHYQFAVDNVRYEVEVSAAMAAFAAAQQDELPLPTRTERQPLTVSLDELLDTAVWLDEREKALGLKPSSWPERMEQLCVAVRQHDGNYLHGSEFTLDGLFHLVGPLGAGKSTLIWGLTAYLARTGRHVSVVLNTVVESIRFAHWLRQMGISATPALGRNRADHARKYEMAEGAAYTEEALFQPDANHPIPLRWISAPCALSGALPKPIPVGKEPCYRLESPAGDGNHHCPLLPVCPVHQIYRDLRESRVWVMNPLSLLHSSAPDGLGKSGTRLLEAAYQTSDVLIIDEADSVQVRWDQAFAPSLPMVGKETALLEWLRRQLMKHGSGEGRTRSADAVFNRICNIDDQANTLANRIYRLLNKYKWLHRWFKNRQMTHANLISRLAKLLSKKSAAARTKEEKAALAQTLYAELMDVVRRSGRAQPHPLQLWLTHVLSHHGSENVLNRELQAWLDERLGWKADKANPAYRHTLKKLDITITLAALMQRFGDVLHETGWIEQEFGRFGHGELVPANTIRALMPDSPLDILLGLRLVSRNEQMPGVFNLIRNFGMGRWLLLNLPSLYRDLYGWLGPHVILTSATSWMPKSSQFHLAPPPDAILQHRSPQKSRITLEYKPVLFRGQARRVSGAREDRKLNALRAIARSLGDDTGNTLSRIETELRYWAARGEKRRVLLIVGSYEQSSIVYEALDRLPNLAGRVARLIPDDAQTDEDDFVVHTRKVEQLYMHDADVLIAPLLAIQRGFNILDGEQNALLGTVFFLVRPYPPPEDLSLHVLAINARVLQYLEPDGRTLHKARTVKALAAVRKEVAALWSRRLMTGSLSGMDEDVYQMFLRDQFVPIWQTIGRLIRGARDARVFFVDGAFAPKTGRHLLRDWHQMLQELQSSASAGSFTLADALYADAAQAFADAAKNNRLE